MGYRHRNFIRFLTSHRANLYDSKANKISDQANGSDF